MSLQDIFYLVAIVTMSLITIFFVVAVVLLFYIKHKTSQILDIVELNLRKAQDIVTHPAEMAGAIGRAVVDSAVTQVTNMATGSVSKARRRIKK